MSKYNPLTERLRGHPGDHWQASFSEIEEVLGFPLPKGAKSGKAWWANDSDKSHVKAWTGEGWQADDVDHAQGVVTFRRSDISPVALEAVGAMEPVGDLDDVDLDMPDPPPPPYAAPDAMAHAQPALHEGGSPDREERPTGAGQAWQDRARTALQKVPAPKGLGAVAMVAGGVALVAGITALIFRRR